MDFPLEIGYGNFKLSAHLLSETLAFVVGYRYYLFLRKDTQDAISESNRLWIIIGAAFGAFFFSRLVGSFEVPSGWAKASSYLLYFFQNKTIVGGLLGGLLGVEFAKKLIHEKHSSGDLFTFPIILAIIIGRVGCFSSGVHEPTFGIETTLPWGLDLGDGLKRHPVALYEILFLLILWLGLWMLQKKISFKSGYIFQFFMINYYIFRFFLEYIKPVAFYQIGLTGIQMACLFVLGYYSRTLLFLFFKPKKLVAGF
ncbi:prolipoprotein diacylglyceryl transferase [Flammeovirgaceae bacterium SG7u.111]|nr:prolipoprotein diacylglyceryl transferase [Flammeovirgaceae bacterium SG7u.132]WPO33208.1 prolipoprotein diacylglyceryl transferase [Flammeovirgaceae bacterium SG7u.111]